MTNQNYQCVNTIGFIFDTAKVKIKQKKKKVPKSSNSSSLTTTYSTYKSKSDSSSSNSFYSSNSIYSSNSSIINSSSTKLSSLTNSSYSSLTNSSYSLSDNSSSICLKPPKLPCLATPLFTNKSSTVSDGCCKDTTYSKSLCTSDSGSTINCLSSECNSSFFKNNDLLTNKPCKIQQKCDQNNLCIKPICYEPSLCEDAKKLEKTKQKCGHKEKKKFKTDIFNKINKYCLIKVNKHNFVSSTLSVCTDNKNDCWVKFTENIYELLGGSFLITLTKCNTFRSLYCQLIKIDYCSSCEELKLFFRYNILPPKNLSQEDCLNNINNVDLYYKLEDSIYNNLRFYYDHEYNFNPRYFLNI
jgi:hypothetical protein